jgi:leucyl aminopeptidase
MKTIYSTEALAQLICDALVIGVYEGNIRENRPLTALDAPGVLDGLLHRVTEDEQFTGKKGQLSNIVTLEKIKSTRVYLVGLGKLPEEHPGPGGVASTGHLRDFAAQAVRMASAANCRRVGLAVTAAAGTPRAALAALFEGAGLGGYRFTKYLSGDRGRPSTVEEVVVAGMGASMEPALVGELSARAAIVTAAVRRARDWVNEPAGTMTPAKVADLAGALAGERGLECQVLGPAECEQLGMGMFLGVGQGSDNEPRFIHLAYRPRKDAAGSTTRRVVLIGKGVTFDSGGLSLKPSASMETMKMDMAGAAVVLSSLAALAELGVPYEVHALAACAENMVSGRSYKLGDVLRSMSGKTVEINNTDAEGRLTLGDAIAYAKRIEPTEIFDFATLTGACMVALGPYTAGVFTNHPSLRDRWMAAATRAGEDMWALPAVERLKDQLKSDIADMKNTGDRYGGAITAGLFLREFVGDVPWVHVDLAGPAFSDKESGAVTKGGTGFGVASILEYLSPVDPAVSDGSTAATRG